MPKTRSEARYQERMEVPYPLNRGKSKFRIMTVNMQGGDRIDSGKWMALRAKIDQHKPLAVCIQESSNTFEGIPPHAIHSETQMYTYNQEWGIKTPVSRCSLTILTRCLAEKFEKIIVYGTRPILGVKLKKNLTVYCIHAKSGGATTKGVIEQCLNELHAKNPEPWILAGDFNCERIATASINSVGIGERSRSVTQVGVDLPTHIGGRNLDYAFHTDGFISKIVDSGNFGSDHCYLIFEFEQI